MLRSFVGVVVDSRRSEVVVVCPGCGKAWPRDLEICPDDGTWLHEDTAADHAAYEPPRLDDTIAEDDDLAPPPSRDLAPGTPCGDYEIETKIGEGAWGAVYRAIHPTIGKHVAIKVMSHKLFDEPEAHKRFVAEARALASIRHPGIVEIFGIGRLRDGRAFLTMQWLEGETLGARLQRGPLPLDHALEILRQIARALDAAHAKNIVHRDLKPDNVFLVTVDDELSIKLVDFGLAKATKDSAVAVTRSGQMVGTPLYMSPEQCRSKGVDHRTDIYALGCLGYELLCGRVPFVHDNAAELISAHLNDEPPSPRGLRPELAPQIDRMLVRMIAKRPDDRPTLGDIRQTIGGVLRRASQPLQAIAATVDLESATTADDHAAPAKPRGRRWIVIAIAAIVVIALGIFAFSSLSEARHQPPPASQH